MNNARARSSLIGIVGAYLLYTAYQLFEGRNDPGTTMTTGVMILFIVLFVLCGAALLVYAYLLWKRAGQDGEEQKEQREREDKDTLK